MENSAHIFAWLRYHKLDIELGVTEGSVVAVLACALVEEKVEGGAAVGETAVEISIYLSFYKHLGSYLSPQSC